MKMIFAVILKFFGCVLISAGFGVDLVNSQASNGFWGFEEWTHFFGGMAPNNIRSHAALPRTMSDVQLRPQIPPHIADALNRLKQEINNGKQDVNDEPVNDSISSRPKFGMNQFHINRFMDNADDMTSANPMSVPPVRLYQQNNVLVNIERIIKRNSNNSKKKEAQKYLSAHYLPKSSLSQQTYHRPKAPTLEYPNINTVAELPDHFKAVYNDILNRAIKDSTIFKTPHSESNVYKNALTPQLFTNEILFSDIQDKSKDTTTQPLFIQNRMSDDNENERTAYSPLYKPFETFIDRSSLESPTTVSYTVSYTDTTVSNTDTYKVTSAIIEKRDKEPNGVIHFPNIESYKNLPQYKEDDTISTPITDTKETPMNTVIISSNNSAKISSSYENMDVEPNVTIDDNQHLITNLSGNIHTTTKSSMLTAVDKSKPTVTLLSDSDVDKQPDHTTRLLISNEFKNIMFQGVDDISRELENFTINENMSNDSKIANEHKFTEPSQNKTFDYAQDEKDVPSMSTSKMKVVTTTLPTPLLTSEEFRNIMYKGGDNTSHQYDVKETKSRDAIICVQENNTANAENITLGQVDEEKDTLSIDILSNLTSGNDTLLRDEYVDKTNETNTEIEETPKEARLLIDLLTGVMHDDLTNEFGDDFSVIDSVPKAGVPEPSSVYTFIQDFPGIEADSAQVQLNDTFSPELIHKILASYNTETSESNSDMDLYENIDFQDFLENDLIIKQANNNIFKHEDNVLPSTIVHNDSVSSKTETVPERSSEDIDNIQIDVPFLKRKEHVSDTTYINNNDQQTTANDINDDLIFQTYYAGEEIPLSRSNDVDDLKTTFSNFEYTTHIYTYPSNQSNKKLFTENKYTTANDEDAKDVLVTESSRTPFVTTNFEHRSLPNNISTDNNLLKEVSSIVLNSNGSEHITEYFSTPQPISETYNNEEYSGSTTQAMDTIVDYERLKHFKTNINSLNNLIRNLDSVDFADHVGKDINPSKAVDVEEEKSLLQMNNGSLISTTNMYKMIIPIEKILLNEDTTKPISPDYDSKPVDVEEEKSLLQMNNESIISTTNMYQIIIPTEQIFHNESTTESILPDYDSKPVDVVGEKSLLQVNNGSLISTTNIYQNIIPIEQILYNEDTTEPISPDYDTLKSYESNISSAQSSHGIQVPNLEDSTTDRSYTTFLLLAETTIDMQNNTDILPEAREYDVVTVYENEISTQVKNNDKKNNIADMSGMSKSEVSSPVTPYTTFFPDTEMIMDTKSVTEMVFPEIKLYTSMAYTTPIMPEHESKALIEIEKSEDKNNFTEVTAIYNVEESSETTTSVTRALSPESEKYSAVTNTFSFNNLSEFMEIFKEVLPTAETSFTIATPTTMYAENITELFFQQIGEDSSLTDAISVTTEHSNEKKINKHNSSTEMSFDILSTPKFNNMSDPTLTVTNIDQNTDINAVQGKDVDSVHTSKNSILQIK